MRKFRKLLSVLMTSFLMMISTCYAKNTDQFSVPITLQSVSSVEKLSEILDRTYQNEKVATCIETICCKTTSSGSKFCKSVCGLCPLGWFPEY